MARVRIGNGSTPAKHPRDTLADAVHGLARSYRVDEATLTEQLGRLMLVIESAIHSVEGIPHEALDVTHAAVDLIKESLPSSSAGDKAWRNRMDYFSDRLAALARKAYGAPDWAEDDLRELGRKVAIAHLGYQAVGRASPRDMALAVQEMTVELPQLVYFIGAGSKGPIKIGIAADPKARIASLQTGHYEPLKLLALAPGGRERELEYHAMFAAHRLSGEWFARVPDIEAEIVRLQEEV